MGTDIYLSYDGQDQNIEGYWEEGYIRASIGAINENWVLRKVFPEEIWDDKMPENFKYNMDLLEKAQRLKPQYIDSVEKDYLLGSKDEAGVKHGDGIANLFQNLGFGVMQDSGHKSVNSAYAWFRTLENHICIGIAMELLGKNPQVEISW